MRTLQLLWLVSTAGAARIAIEDVTQFESQLESARRDVCYDLDIAEDQHDSGGYHCNFYEPADCDGSYDTGRFSAGELCCACGGGSVARPEGPAAHPLTNSALNPTGVIAVAGPPVNVLIDGSRENTKCVTATVPVSCAGDAGHLGNRINDSPGRDTFAITTNGAEVCVTRTDSAGGWGMQLVISCVATGEATPLAPAPVLAPAPTPATNPAPPPPSTIRPVEPSPHPPQHCVNTDGEARDVGGYQCDSYVEGDCDGVWDDDDFVVAEMCCVCGGGSTATTTTPEPQATMAIQVQQGDHVTLEVEGIGKMTIELEHTGNLTVQR